MGWPKLGNLTIGSTVVLQPSSSTVLPLVPPAAFGQTSFCLRHRLRDPRVHLIPPLLCLCRAPSSLRRRPGLPKPHLHLGPGIQQLCLELPGLDRRPLGSAWVYTSPGSASVCRSPDFIRTLSQGSTLDPPSIGSEMGSSSASSSRILFVTSPTSISRTPTLLPLLDYLRHKDMPSGRGV